VPTTAESNGLFMYEKVLVRHLKKLATIGFVARGDRLGHSKLYPLSQGWWRERIAIALRGRIFGIRRTASQKKNGYQSDYHAFHTYPLPERVRILQRNAAR
jgi:hypothetical protein